MKCPKCGSSNLEQVFHELDPDDRLAGQGWVLVGAKDGMPLIRCNDCGNEFPEEE